MGINEDFHAKKEEVMGELKKGKEIAIHLQTLLRKRHEDDGGPLSLISPDDLALQIFRSFSVSLSHLTSDEIPAVDYGSSGESKRRRGVKDRRGCYKRRRGSDSRVTISPTIEDGWAWRKYGQKKILNSEHPRCYYRCSHKHEGCKAIKQVQRTKGGETISYETTYFNHHTCAVTAGDPHLLLESDPVQRNLISFQTSIQSKQEDSPDPIITLSSFKQGDTRSSEVDASDHEANSSLEDTWQDIIGHDLLAYKHEWAPWFDHYSSQVTSLHEVDQLSDINSFHYFDENINY